jgi:hypothetical protein
MKKAVVIGSGLAGSLLCNELAKDCSVTLLEAGPRDKFEYPSIDFIRKDFGVVKTLCMGRGGTTNLWHNGLMPLRSDDIHSRVFRQVLNESQPYTDRAASQLYFGSASYTAEYAAVRSEMVSAAEKAESFADDVDCLLYPKKYNALTVDSNVKAFYGVSEMDFVHREGRIECVSYRSGGSRHSVNADVAIVSAGTLGTPAVVEKLLSDAGQSFGGLGAGLADHPMGFVGKVKVRKEFAEVFEKLSTLDKGNFICRSAVKVRSECGKYTAGIFFRPALTMQNKLSMYKYKSMLGASKGIERVKSALSPKLFHPDILAEIYSHLFNVNIRSRVYNILLIFEQKRGKNGVSYNGSRIVVDWGISDEEMAVYHGMVRRVGEMLDPIADELVLTMPLTDEWLWSAAHHSGTIPMGSLPEGLVDKDLKVNFFENVFICDGSIIQEHSYANTGLTIGALALRLADRVRAV